MLGSACVDSQVHILLMPFGDMELLRAPSILCGLYYEAPSHSPSPLRLYESESVVSVRFVAWAFQCGTVVLATVLFFCEGVACFTCRWADGVVTADAFRGTAAVLVWSEDCLPLLCCCFDRVCFIHGCVLCLCG